jgi:hypothetical protein
MIPKCKHYTFTANRLTTHADVTGIVLAPTKTLARLNVYALAGYTLINVRIGGVKRKLNEKEKNSEFLVKGD